MNEGSATGIGNRDVNVVAPAVGAGAAHFTGIGGGPPLDATVCVKHVLSLAAVVEGVVAVGGGWGADAEHFAIGGVEVGAGKGVAVVGLGLGVHDHRQADLLEVVGALDAVGLFAGAGEDGEEDCYEECDDADYG